MDLYQNINYEYYGLRDEEDQEMLEEELAYERKAYEKELEKWIDENTDYIKEKLRNVSNPTKEQIINLVDDETYEEFKAKHQTSNKE